jgi:C1A family cysteine protease
LSKYNYGWKKTPSGLTLKKFSESKFFKVMELPPLVDLRSVDSPILDQGQLGSCTGNGIAGCINFLHVKTGETFSRLFVYYNERAIEGTVDQDSGANIDDGINSVKTQGVCLESVWPYDITQFTVKPSDEAYAQASKDVVTDYLQVNSLAEVKRCLAAKFPVVFGINVYESFEDSTVASSGHVPVPQSNEQCLGGHCMKIVGYDDINGWLIVANSWGTGWGDKGYCYLPYAYINSDASDFATIRKDTGE